MQKYYLNSVAEIESGKSFRTKPEHLKDGGCQLIQMKDVSANGINTNLTIIDIEGVNPEQLLKDGDVLFVAKGNKNFAVTFRSSKPSLAVSFFFIIRPNLDLIYPDYLAWYINSLEAQAYFDKVRMGATVGNIRKKALGELEIPVPDISTQVTIESVDRLWKNEKEATMQLMEQKELYYSNLLTKISTNMITTKKPEDTRDWYDIWTHSNYYPAFVKLKSSIKIDGKEVDELVCTFHHLETKNKDFDLGDGRKLSTPQVSAWQYIMIKDLKTWNDPNIPYTLKEKTVLKHLNHDLVKEVALRDRATNKIMLQKANTN